MGHPMNSLFRVGILEDDPNMRAYLETVLGKEPEIQLRFSASTLKKAMAQQTSDLDLCLIDMQLPDGDGIDFVSHLLRTSPVSYTHLTLPTIYSV